MFKKFFRWLNEGHRRFWFFLILVLAVFLLIRKNNIITWIASGFEIASQQREIEHMRKRIDELDKGIEEWNNDPLAAEKYAREKLNFCGEDEDVYLVEE